MAKFEHLEWFDWLFCADDCPCSETIFAPLLKQLQEEHDHWFKGKAGSLDDPDFKALETELWGRREEYYTKRRELRALVEQKKLRYVEMEEQLDVLQHELASRPWESALGQKIAAAIKEYHDAGKSPLLLEYKPEMLVIEQQSEPSSVSQTSEPVREEVEA